MKIRNIGILIIAFFALNSCKKISFEEDGKLVPLTVMEDESLPAITVNGIRLHSQTFGNPSDPMIVMLHGGPGGDYQGLLNFKQLANDSLFIVFYDQRGSGLSQRLDKNEYPNVQVFIDELEGIINHYRKDNSQKVVLAGHSWGAMLAAAYINQKPNDIKGLILMEPGGLTWDQVKTYTGRSRKINLFDESTNDFLYQDQFITGDDHNTLDYKMALSTAGNVATGDISSAPFLRFGAICNAASLSLGKENPEQINFTTNLSNYTTEVLFAYSELNTAYGLDHAELVSEPLPRVELVKILGCGHEIPQFGWDNLYPKIKNYLTKIL